MNGALQDCIFVSAIKTKGVPYVREGTQEPNFSPMDKCTREMMRRDSEAHDLASNLTQATGSQS